MNRSEMEKSARAASSAAIFAYDLLDFLMLLERESPEREDAVDDEILVSQNDWVGFWRDDRERPSTAATVGRAFERWKDKAAGYGFGRRTGAAFAIDRHAARDWAEETIRLGNELAEAYRVMTGRQLDVLKAPGGKIVRTMTAIELARRLGVEVGTIYRWAQRGAPHDRRRLVKSRDDYAFDENEIRAWLAVAMDESRRMAGHHEERIPFAEGKRRLRAVRDSLGLTTQGLADQLGVSDHALRSWVYETEATDTVPLKVVLDAEALAVDRGIPLEKLKETEKDERMSQEEAAPRLLAVRKKLNLSTASFAQLLGVKAVTLKSWMGTGGKIASSVPVWAVEGAEKLVETMEPRIYRSVSSKLADPKKVRDAFAKALGSTARAARILGVVPSAAQAVARRLGIETTTRIDLTKVVSPEDLRESLERLEGNATAASQELGVDRPSVLRLAERYGLSDLVRERVEIEVDPEALREAVLRLGSVRAAANELGLSRSTALRLARAFGLSDFIYKGFRRP